MDDRSPEYLTVPQAIVHFSISRTTIYGLLARNCIEGIKLGRRTLIRTESVRRFLAEQTPFSAR
jgi:excisionase family DNA binding protein